MIFPHEKPHKIGSLTALIRIGQAPHSRHNSKNIVVNGEDPELVVQVKERKNWKAGTVGRIPLAVPEGWCCSGYRANE